MLVRTSKLALLASAMALAPLAVQAQSAQTYNLAAQPMAATLRQLAQTSGRNILFSPDVTRGKISAPVRGAANFDAALRAALAGSGLTYTIEADGSATVVAAKPAARQAAARTRGGQAAEPKTAADSSDDMIEELVVYGRNQPRQLQEISSKAISRLAPGSSPLKAVAKLPGVSLQSSDPFGIYELGTRISVRGFNQSQMGFTLDGVPLGDMLYNNWNGLHISRAISAENLERTVVSQGAGSLGIASTSNLGGNIEFFSRAPQSTFGGELAVSGGTDNLEHYFGRLETGELPSHTRAYLSVSSHKADKWKGYGDQTQKKANLKIVQEIGDLTITGWYNHVDHRERNYGDLSPATLKSVGYGLDFLAPDFDTAILIAQIAANQKVAAGGTLPYPAAGRAFPAPWKATTDTAFDSGGLRRDNLWAFTAEKPVGDWLDLKATVYGHDDKGSGGIYTNAVATPGGSLLSLRTTEYAIDRTGALVNAIAHLGDHKVEAGFWWEDNDITAARRYYAVPNTGPRPDVLSFLDNPFRTDWNQVMTAKTQQFFVSDTWRATDDLNLYAGIKALRVTNSIRTTQFYAAASNLNGGLKAKDSFLPQVGFTYSLTPHHQLFGDYAENLRAFQSSFKGAFGTSQAGFDAVKTTLKPETSRTVELGWRVDYGKIRGSIAAYDVLFENRLLALTIGANILGNPTVLQNVGSVKTRGVELAGTWDIRPDLSLYGSYSYNDSEYQQNTFDGTKTILTGGKTAIDTPKALFQTELSYDNGVVFGALSGSYTGKRYFTYTNDGSVEGYGLVDLSLGYRVQAADRPYLDGLEVQANITNLLDKKYIGALGSSGFFNDLTAVNNTLQAGAPRSAFLTVRKRF